MGMPMPGMGMPMPGMGPPPAEEFPASGETGGEMKHLTLHRPSAPRGRKKSTRVNTEQFNAMLDDF
jgi:hypothetical protein